MQRLICFGGLSVAIILAVCGCSGENSSGGGDNNPAQSNTSQTTNAHALAGKTLQFMVTMSHNFSEPVGAVYTIEFHSDQTYTFHPSPQNHEGLNLENGSFTYDPDTGSIHFTRPDHQDIDGQFTFSTSSAGTVHLVGPEGETEDATFEQVAG